jgi:alkaline phosphatase
MNKKNVFVILLAVCLLGIGCEAENLDTSYYRPAGDARLYNEVSGDQVRNVILLIGDGMGPSQVMLARIASVGPERRLHMEKMPHVGLATTYSANSAVTDSAAAATALATGHKTRNGMIGMTPDRQPVQTILEAARDKGMATGLVATSAITHATPAGFAAHVTSRNMEAEIAEQLIEGRVNVLLGGGRHFFMPVLSLGSKRLDNTDLIARAIDYGYNYVDKVERLDAAAGPYLLGLFEMDALKAEPQPDDVTLRQLTGKAIEVLAQDPDGFFLMVEGSQIDWECHSHDEKGAIAQTLMFDEAVKAAIDFAQVSRQTLVIVTADHETGGLAITGGKAEAGSIPGVDWASGGHSGGPVPVYAFGPGGDAFEGLMDNTDISKKIADLLGVSLSAERAAVGRVEVQLALSSAE